MRQFDLCRVEPRGNIAFVLVLQSDWLHDVRTRVVAPVLPAHKYRRVPKLHPLISLNGVDHIIAFELLMTVPIRDLGRVVRSCEDLREAISRGVDALLYGN